MSSNQILPKVILPNSVLNSILKTGLVIVGAKGTGKSNAGKVLSAEIIRKQPLPIQVKIFDSCMNWRWNYESILYQTINLETRYFYDGEKHILFDLEILDDDDVMKFMEKVIIADYYKQRERKEELGGHNDKWILYVIEEAQNILGSYSLMRKSGRKLLKMFAEGRNYGLSFILIGQRLADVSTKAIERCNGYLFGRMNGDNDIAKLRRIVGRRSTIIDEVKKLKGESGEFIYYPYKTRGREVACPEYKPINSNDKPILWTLNKKNVPMWGKQIG